MLCHVGSVMLVTLKVTVRKATEYYMFCYVCGHDVD